MTENSYKLRSYLTAVIKRSDNIVEVELHSTHHVNKITKVTHQYNPEFTDAEILVDRDFKHFVEKRFGTE